jgi:hypothetical protein
MPHRFVDSFRAGSGWNCHGSAILILRGAYSVLVRRPEERNPLGIPRRRWKDTFKMDLREGGLGDMDWNDVA